MGAARSPGGGGDAGVDEEEARVHNLPEVVRRGQAVTPDTQNMKHSDCEGKKWLDPVEVFWFETA